MITKTLAAAAALALGLGAGLPAPVDAQAAPTITATPSLVEPGDTVTVVATCDSEPPVQALSRYSVGEDPYFPAYQPVPVTEGPAGTWTGSYVADHDPEGDGVDDVSFYNFCEGRLRASVLVDVEDPALRFGGPRGNDPVWPTTEDPTVGFGTDCPAGSTVAVVVSSGDQVVELTAPLDERGDWVVDLPAADPGSTQTVTASCGDLTYDPVSRVVPLLTTTTSTTATTTTTPATTSPPVPMAGSAPAPRPATPRPGVAAYTG